MSAPVSEISFSSISSSGHVDGLGRRSLSFDRETGAILERVQVRPELAAFEQILRRRVERLSTIEEERFARPSAVEHDPSTGELVVVAEFVTGSRLSELLEVSADTAVVPGVDVALGYLLDSFSALSVLHTTNRVIHGLIDPSRTILTVEGQVVFLDLAFGPAIEALNLTPHRLWTEFGVSTSSPSGPVRFDPTGDVTQVALGALMLVLGRNLRVDEYPDALPTLLMEVIEVAHIRGTTAFAGGLQRILQRSLPLPGRRPYMTADEALSDVRQLVRKEIGLEACRQAVVDFVAQMDAAFAGTGAAADRSAASASEGEFDSASFTPRVPELDHFLDTIGTNGASEGHTHDEIRDTDLRLDSITDDFGDDDEEETELSLDQIEPVVAPQTDEVYDLSALDDLTLADPTALSSEIASFHEAESEAAAPDYDLAEPAALVEEEPYAPETVAPETVQTAAEPPAESTERSDEEVVPEPPRTDVGQEDEAPVSVAAVESTEIEPDVEKESVSSRRRKRQQMKSARARKDKLRSTTADVKVPPPPIAPPPPARPASPSGWQVSSQRAGTTESLIPEPMAAPAPVRPVQVPTISFTPTPVGPLPQPTYANQSANVPAYGSPTIAKSAPKPAPIVVAPAPPQLKIKADPPAGFSSARRTHFEPSTVEAPPDRFSTLSLGRSNDEPDTPRAFPWKLAAVAVGVAVIAILAGRSYLPGRTAVAGEPGAPTESATAPKTPPPVVADTAPKSDSSIPAGKGRVLIQTQPPGIKVLLDRKPVGDTPVQVDTTPGRHVLTFITSGGEVLHSMRVVGGKTVTLDIPVFSGWVSVFAPILLDISENGRSLGNTEQNRLMLPPGRHQLTLSNKDLAFSEVRDVDIEPGGVRNITVEARGSANINASPWAEVWLDGKKIGETPLASLSVPLGLHEFLFKHPQHGERRVSTTVRANAPAQISVDFTK